MEKLKNYYVWLVLFCAGLFFSVSCTKEEDWDAGKTKVVADFEYSLSAEKAPATLTLTSKSTGGYTYYWTYPGGADPGKGVFSILKEPAPVTYKNGGTYNITLSVCNGTSCDSITKSFTLEDPDVTPEFTYAYVGGNDWAPASVTYTDQSIGATGWTWTFDGGNPASFQGQNPGTVAYANYGKFATKLQATSSKGSEAITNYVKIYPTELICSSMTTQIWKTPLKYSGMEIGFVAIYLDKERINKTDELKSKSVYRIYITEQAAAILTGKAKAIDYPLPISWDWDVVDGVQKLNMTVYYSGVKAGISSSITSLSGTEMKFSKSEFDPLFNQLIADLLPLLSAPLTFSKIKP